MAAETIALIREMAAANRLGPYLRRVRERLDHVLVLSEAHLRRALRAYVGYFNCARPHQGIGQAIPAGVAEED